MKKIVFKTTQFDRSVDKLMEELNEAIKVGATHYRMHHTGNDPSWPDAWWIEFYYVETEEQTIDREIAELEEKIRSLSIRKYGFK